MLLINFCSFYFDTVFSKKKKIMAYSFSAFLQEFIVGPAICMLEKIFQNFLTTGTRLKIQTQIVVIIFVLYFT